MSREIKFRAWIKTPQGCYMAIQGTPDIETLQSFMFHYGDRELMQFTGLKDKNGCEIYEGDVLQHIRDKRLFNWLVVFNNGCFGIQNLGIEGYLGTFFPIDSVYYFSDRIVIGNIYDNPEL